MIPYMELFKLLGTIAVENSGAISAIDETTKSTSSMAEKFASGIATAAKWGAAIVGATTAAGTALIAVATKAASAGDNIDKMSQKIGISRQAYQELDFICSQSGTSVDSLQMGIKTLTNQMQSASAGTKSAVAIFEQLGISIYDTNGQLKDQESMMWEAMSALQAMENQTEKAALATDLFGRSGSELMPLLNGAEGSIESMKQQAHELGLVLSDELVDESVKFTDTMDQFKRSVSSAGTKIFATFMPHIQTFVNLLVKNMPKLQEFASVISNKIGDAIEWASSKIKNFKKIMSEAHDYLCDTVYFGFEAVWEGVKNLANAFKPFVDAVKSFIEPLKDVNEQQKINIEIVYFLEEALYKVADVFNIAASVVSTVFTFISEHKTLLESIVIVIGSFAAAFVLVTGAVKTFTGVLALLQTAMTAISAIMSSAGAAIAFIASPVGIAVAAIGTLIAIGVLLYKNWDEVKAKAVDLWKSLKATFVKIKETISETMNAIWSKIVESWESIKVSISTKISDIVSTVSAKFEEVRNSIKTKIDSAKESVKDAIETIKGFFNFEFKWPNIPLPHFSINPSGWKVADLLKGIIPSLGIEWYAKGGVLEEATAFGINGNKLMVGGEAGPEAVAPIDVLQKYIAEAVAAQNTGLVDILQKILAAILSNNEEMKDKFMEALEEMRFDINNREFARLVKAVN